MNKLILIIILLFATTAFAKDYVKPNKSKLKYTKEEHIEYGKQKRIKVIQIRIESINKEIQEYEEKLIRLNSLLKSLCK